MIVGQWPESHSLDSRRVAVEALLLASVSFADGMDCDGLQSIGSYYFYPVAAVSKVNPH